MIDKRILKKLLVPPGRKIDVGDYGTTWKHIPELKRFSGTAMKKRAADLLALSRARLAKAQETALCRRPARAADRVPGDGRGRQGRHHPPRHVRHQPAGLSGLQLQDSPATEELDHTFLWRCMKSLPERGRIGIFNRSYYEDVLVVKVHRGLARQAAADRPESTIGSSGATATTTSTPSSTISCATAPSILKFFLQRVQGANRRSDFSTASTIRPSTGSSRPPISPNGSTGSSTWRPTARRSARPARPGRRGTSSRRTTSRSPAPPSPTSSPRRSARSISNIPRSRKDARQALKLARRQLERE